MGQTLPDGCRRTDWQSVLLVPDGLPIRPTNFDSAYPFYRRLTDHERRDCYGETKVRNPGKPGGSQFPKWAGRQGVSLLLYWIVRRSIAPRSVPGCSAFLTVLRRWVIVDFWLFGQRSEAFNPGITMTKTDQESF